MGVSRGKWRLAQVRPRCRPDPRWPFLSQRRVARRLAVNACPSRGDRLDDSRRLPNPVDESPPASRALMERLALDVALRGAGQSAPDFALCCDGRPFWMAGLDLSATEGKECVGVCLSLQGTFEGLPVGVHCADP